LLFVHIHQGLEFGWWWWRKCNSWSWRLDDDDDLTLGKKVSGPASPCVSSSCCLRFTFRHYLHSHLIACSWIQARPSGNPISHHTTKAFLYSKLQQLTNPPSIDWLIDSFFLSFFCFLKTSHKNLLVYLDTPLQRRRCGISENKKLTSIPFSELSHLDFHLCFAVNADDMYPPSITRNKSKMEKYTYIQYPSIFKWCNAPALRHYPTIPRRCVPKGRPGGGGVGAQNDKEMHRYIRIQ
jgi:hypothetical protein